MTIFRHSTHQDRHFQIRMNRRHFLAGLGAGSVVWSIVSRNGLSAVLQSSEQVVVGAHPWVYAATLPDYDITPVLDQIFADMSAAGIEGIELMHTALRPEDSVSRIAALSEKYSLPVIGTSFEGKMWDRNQHQAVWEDAERVVTRLARLGGKTLGTSVGRAPARKTEDQLDAQAELLERIIKLCHDHGVTLNLHNHTYEVVDEMHDLRGTLERLPDTPLGPDLNWLLRGGVEPVEFILEFGKQIVFLHLRDQNPDGRWSEALGEGSTDFQAIAAALHRINFTGYAVIELAHEGDFKPTRPLRDSLRMSRQFVSQVLKY